MSGVRKDADAELHNVTAQGSDHVYHQLRPAKHAAREQKEAVTGGGENRRCRTRRAGFPRTAI